MKIPHAHTYVYIITYLTRCYLMRQHRFIDVV